MHTRSIFRDFRLPVACRESRLPVFFDFTKENANDESTSAQPVTEVLRSAFDQVDGVILPPGRLEPVSGMFGKETWVRADFHANYSPKPKNKKTYGALSSGAFQSGASQSNLQEWVHNNITGVVGTLFLGNAASFEADNIQNLFSLRSMSLEMGLPLLIDLQVLEVGEEDPLFPEAIELGLDLAVEIGCNLAILPDGHYLAVDENIEKIASIPLLTSLPIQKWIDEDPDRDERKKIMDKVDGIVFTGLQNWNNPNLSQLSTRSTQGKPGGK